MCLTYYDRTTKTCHILSKNLSIVLKLLSDDRAAPTELSILVSIRLFISLSLSVSQYNFFLHFHQSHSPFTSASYINFKMKRAKKKAVLEIHRRFHKVICDATWHLSCRSFSIWFFFFAHDFNLNCSQSNGIHSYRIFVFSLFPFNM